METSIIIIVALLLSAASLTLANAYRNNSTTMQACIEKLVSDQEEMRRGILIQYQRQYDGFTETESMSVSESTELILNHLGLEIGTVSQPHFVAGLVEKAKEPA